MKRLWNHKYLITKNNIHYDSAFLLTITTASAYIYQQMLSILQLAVTVVKVQFVSWLTAVVVASQATPPPFL